MKTLRLAVVFMIALGWACATLPAYAQDGPPQYVRDAVDAVMTMLDSDGDPALTAFISTAMVSREDRDQEKLMKQLSAIRDDLRDLRDDVRVEAEPDGVRLVLSGGDVEKQIRVVLGPKGISEVYRVQVEPGEPIRLTRDNLQETFDRLERDGMSGVVYVKIDGQVVLKRAFGTANDNLGLRNTVETVFGTGSRPIDYTRAAIFLLEQQGRIAQDDSITKYFERVPQPMRTITIHHLMSGQSGLPDFFHTDNDWDADLAWLDRKTAEERLLSQDLLFAPGSDRRHSHGAYVLLAALIERVTGKPYYDFIRENFLDPAGMGRTGEYGERRDLTEQDFAVGNGPQRVGLPNIPPNWGPTSWLIKGSGGMYSTLGDQLRFYEYIRSGKGLDTRHGAAFRQPTVSLDGSVRGFELFSAYHPRGNEVFLFLNAQGESGRMQLLYRALEQLAGL